MVDIQAQSDLQQQDQLLEDPNYAIQTRLKNFGMEIRCAMPGQIISYDPATQMCSAQLSIKRKMIDGTVVATPPLPRVPVLTYGAAGGCLTVPINPGDECLLVFQDRFLDAWFQNGPVSDPSLYNYFHSLSNAVAIVGLHSLPNVIQNYSTTGMQLRSVDGATHVSVNLDGSVDIATGSNKVINADSSGNITLRSNTNTSVKINADGTIALQTAGGPTIALDAAGNVTITAPTTTINGALVVNGAVSATSVAAGSISASSSMTVAGESLAGHTHAAGSYTAPSGGGPVTGTSGPLT